jgi:anthranilate/para-aminobenzoate synthase component I
MIYVARSSEAATQSLPGRPHRDGTAFLERWPDFGSKSVLAQAPVRVIEGNLFQDAEELRQSIREGRRSIKQGALDRWGGLFGWVGFDGSFCFGDFPECEVTDQIPWHIEMSRPSTGAEPAVAFVPQTTRAQFVASVERAKEYIAAGDIYQVNLSYPWLAEWPEDLEPLEFYQRLREASPAPYAAYMDLAGTQVFSASPECFLSMRGRKIRTRPIKGTRPRSGDAASDVELREELRASAKERAELVMITDLERNDLGKVCEFGSVRVSELLSLESFAQVHHLVSTVEGTLRRGMDHVDALLACFPGGSISGAPKKRALEIIRELEPHDRGMYTGAIGCLGYHGESHFSIAIRTAWRQGKVLQFHTGAGIVADSIPELEYEETRHKAAGLLKAATLDSFARA